MNEIYCHICKSYRKSIHNCEVEQLKFLLSVEKAKKDSLIECLKFYGDKKHWKDLCEEFIETGDITGGVRDCIVYDDCEKDVGGKLARQVLKEIGEEK